MKLRQDRFNETLISHVRPTDWANPIPAPRYNLVVIGAGTAGLVAAAIAAGLGARVALIEKRLLGGDCLNFGCVPSKALIRSSKAYDEISKCSRFGIEVDGPLKLKSGSVMEWVRSVRSRISENDSVHKFSKLGVDVFIGDACFTGPSQVSVGDSVLDFIKAAICTGTHPVLPEIRGLKHDDCLTNETVFELNSIPDRLAVIGAGPVGCELAQAFARLGSKVTLFHKHSRILEREDEEASDILQTKFMEDGIGMKLNTVFSEISSLPRSKTITFIENSVVRKMEVDEILASTGRSPNIQGLALEKAGVGFDSRKGILVNDYLQTSNPNIFAAGDVCMNHKFTHAADAAARLMVKNSLFRKSSKVSELVIPWCVYTDPEIAHVGLYERKALETGLKVRTFVVELREVDRAITDGVHDGFVKMVIDEKSDKILGATVVGPNAGELISGITLAIKNRLGMKSISSTIYPYPTQSLAIKRTADKYVGSKLTQRLKWALGKWFWLKRIL